MRTKLDELWLTLEAKFNDFWDHMVNEEKGAAEIVAIILIILVVIAIVVIFRNRITGLVNNVFDKTDTDLGISSN